jgi:hypothetical protein
MTNVQIRRMQMLADKSELHELALRYARAIDRRDRALLLACYHPDAIDHHGAVFRGDPVAYADWQPQIMAQFAVTAHYIMNTLYCVDGDDAQGELYFVAYHRTIGPPPRDVVVGGRYLDRYQRRAGEWRIGRSPGTLHARRIARRPTWSFSARSEHRAAAPRTPRSGRSRCLHRWAERKGFFALPIGPKLAYRACSTTRSEFCRVLRPAAIAAAAPAMRPKMIALPTPMPPPA